MDTFALGIGFLIGAGVMFLIDTFTFIKRAVEKQTRKDIVTIKFDDLDESGVREMQDILYALWRENQYDKERE